MPYVATNANDGQCLNLVSFSASKSAVVPTLLDRTLVHRRYLPNNVRTHLPLSISTIKFKKST